MNAGVEGVGGKEAQRTKHMVYTFSKDTRHHLSLTQEPVVTKNHCWETMVVPEKRQMVTCAKEGICDPLYCFPALLGSSACSVKINMLSVTHLSSACSALHWGQVKRAVTGREVTNFPRPGKSLAELTVQSTLKN